MARAGRVGGGQEFGFGLALNSIVLGTGPGVRKDSVLDCLLHFFTGIMQSKPGQ